MLLAGDEVRRTQGGNNNAYCQDNETSWFDWSLVARHADVHRFAKGLIALRSARRLPAERFDMTLAELLAQQPVEWHGVRLNAPDWNDWSHSLGVTSRLLSHRFELHLMINAWWEPLEFEIPPPDGAGAAWRRMIDTALDSPDDIAGWPEAPAVPAAKYAAQPRSIVLLMARTR
jgi:glycogen operon protein